MTVAYFDCFSGISGDMVLGALVDSGLSIQSLEEDLSKLGLSEYELSSRKVKKHGIEATKVDVITSEGIVHRTLQDIQAILEHSDLSDSAKKKSSEIFLRLAHAEAEVHGTTIDKVHFHEVGAVDAIVDIVGAVVGLERLGIDQIYSSPLRFGTGVTRGSHGAMPIPVPAVVALTSGVSTERTDIPFELVTPTGAAILTTLADGIGSRISIRTRSIGYGAGNRDMDQIPNLLRVQVGESIGEIQQDAPRLIETNIDDMTPEIYGYLIDRLLSEGAKDAFLTPIIMKKGRPGIQISVLADPDKVTPLSDILFRETTTLGVRITSVNRRMLPRREGTISTAYGPVKVKIAEWQGGTRVTPEYEDCARIAREREIPILDVYRAASGSD